MQRLSNSPQLIKPGNDRCDTQEVCVQYNCESMDVGTFLGGCTGSYLPHVGSYFLVAAHETLVVPCVGPGFLTRDLTPVPCIGNAES